MSVILMHMNTNSFLGLSFVPIKLEDRAPLESFLLRYPQTLCDYTFASLFAWRELYTRSWCMFEEHTLLLGLQIEGQRHLTKPIGKFPQECQHLLIQEAKKLGYPLHIYGVDQQFIDEYAPFCSHFEPMHMREADNYVYAAKDLASLQGRRYSKKRNLIAQGDASYEWTVAPLVDCKRILKEIAPADLTKELQQELKALESMCHHLANLSPSGIQIRIEDKPVAFSIYDHLNPDTAVIYFEKAEKQYKGLHQLINRETAKRILQNGYKYINREDDLGHQGLRQAKLSYHPSQMIKCFRLTYAST